MSGFLLDTNVISELTRPRPEPRVTQWLDSVDESLLFLSVLTLGEIRNGVRMLQVGQRRAHLEMWFNVELASRFAMVTRNVQDFCGSSYPRVQSLGRSSVCGCLSVYTAGASDVCVPAGKCRFGG
jgi:hypothetical protein